MVTVQIPVYNERHVVRRAIDAAAGLDYPRNRLELQILDDSTDETTRLAEARAAFWRERGVNIRVLHRSERAGFKAGALAQGLQQARGEFIAVFGADFCPRPDFLRRVIPHFQADPRLGTWSRPAGPTSTPTTPPSPAPRRWRWTVTSSWSRRPVAGPAC